MILEITYNPMLELYLQKCQKDLNDWKSFERLLFRNGITWFLLEMII